MILPDSFDAVLSRLGIDPSWRDPDPARLVADLDALRPLPGQSPLDRLAHIAPVLARWQDPMSPERRVCAELLPAVSGFSAPMIAAGMALQAARWAPAALEAAMHRGHPRLGHRPQRTAVVSAGNVPGIGALDLVWSVLAGAPVAVKMSRAEPVTALVLVHGLAGGFAGGGPATGAASSTPSSPPALARLWRGGDPDRDGPLLGWADRLLAYGRDETVDALAAAAPGSVHVQGFGHRVSAAIVPRGGMSTGEAARRLAVDVILWDQEGCLSPHVVLVEGSTEAVALAEALVPALSRVADELPRGTLDVSRKAAIRRAVSEAEVRSMAGSGLCAVFPAREAHVILSEDEELRPSPLGRTIRVVAITDLDVAAARLAGWRGRLQSLGVAAPVAALAGYRELARSLGATRVSVVGRMQEPGPGWFGQEPDANGEVRVDLDPEDDGVWSRL